MGKELRNDKEGGAMNFIKNGTCYFNPEQITLIYEYATRVDLHFSDGNKVSLTHEQWENFKEVIESL